MKILSCLFCEGELDLVDPESISPVKKVKCNKCTFTTQPKVEKQLEVYIRRK